MASFITLLVDGKEIVSVYSTLSVDENYSKIRSNIRSAGSYISSSVREKCSWIKFNLGSKKAIYRIRTAASAN